MMRHAGRRRRVALAAVAALVLSMGCDRDDPPPPPGQIEQPVATAVVGERVFVASPGADGLKVLDLSVAGGAFVRAPNPLHALEIPAVRRPSTVHALPGEGGRRGIVVVLSALDGQLRLVDADALVPLGRPVALPGRPVAVDHGPEGDVLFVAVDRPDGDGDPGAVVVIALSADALDAGVRLGSDEAVATDVSVVPLEIRPGGLAVSEIAGGETSVWVSDVDAPQVLQLDAVGAVVNTLDSGEPLARLVASPPIPGSPTDAKGRFVYGLTVEGDGMVAVDTRIEEIAEAQRVGETVLPMRFPSRAVALTVVPRALVDVGEGDAARRGLEVPFLVLASLIDGRVFYGHGERMVPVDVDGDFEPTPSVTMVPGADDTSAPVLETLANPAFEESDDEPARIPRVTTTPGVTRTRTWRIIHQGEVPGQSPALGSVEAGTVTPASPPDDLDARVLPGDRLTITAWHGGEVPDGCAVFEAADPLAWNVASVDAETGAIGLEVREGGPPLPTVDCFAEAVVYRIRASGILVTASGLDAFFRLGPGETFEYEGARFVRTDPLVDGPEIRFTLAEDQNLGAMAPGAERRLRVSSGLEPIVAAPDTAGLGVAQASIPGQLAVFKADPATFGTGRIFVPYAGPGYLVSFDLRTRGAQRLHR
jgi:hypothetical protein